MTFIDYTLILEYIVYVHVLAILPHVKFNNYNDIEEKQSSGIGRESNSAIGIRLFAEMCCKSCRNVQEVTEVRRDEVTTSLKTTMIG